MTRLSIAVSEDVTWKIVSGVQGDRGLLPLGALEHLIIGVRQPVQEQEGVHPYAQELGIGVI